MHLYQGEDCLTTYLELVRWWKRKRKKEKWRNSENIRL